MTNSYYTNIDPPQPVTKARAGNEDSDRSRLTSAFDLLPSPTQINQGNPNYAADTGAANAYVVSMPNITAYAEGQTLVFKPANTNTGASVINVSGLGNKSILRPDGTAAITADIVAGSMVNLGYNGTAWILSPINVTLASGAVVFASAAEAQALASTTTLMSPYLTGLAVTAALLLSPVLSGGTIDGSVIGGTTPAAITATTLNATGGGALTGTWSDLGTVTTVDLNGGTIDGTVIGGTTPAAITATTLNATGGGALTGTWSDLGTVTTMDLNGGTIDGTVIGATSTAAITGTNITATGTLDATGVTTLANDLVVNIDTDGRLAITGETNETNGISIHSKNSADSAYRPLEFLASEYVFGKDGLQQNSLAMSSAGDWTITRGSLYISDSFTNTMLSIATTSGSTTNAYVRINQNTNTWYIGSDFTNTGGDFQIGTGIASTYAINITHGTQAVQFVDAVTVAGTLGAGATTVTTLTASGEIIVNSSTATAAGSNGLGHYNGDTTNGAYIIGKGSTYDVVLARSNGGVALGVNTGTFDVDIFGALDAQATTVTTLTASGATNLDGVLTKIGGGTSAQTVGLVIDHGSNTGYNLIQAENDNGTWFTLAGDGVATFAGDVSAVSAAFNDTTGNGLPLSLDVSSGNTNIEFKNAGTVRWYMRSLHTSNDFELYNNALGSAFTIQSADSIATFHAALRVQQSAGVITNSEAFSVRYHSGFQADSNSYAAVSLKHNGLYASGARHLNLFDSSGTKRTGLGLDASNYTVFDIALKMQIIESSGSVGDILELTKGGYSATLSHSAGYSTWNLNTASRGYLWELNSASVLAITTDKKVYTYADIIVPSGSRLRIDGTSAGDTYLVEGATNRIDFYAGGSQGLNVWASGAGVPSGSKIYFDGGGDSYLSEYSSNTVGMYCGATKIMAWDSASCYSYGDIDPGTDNTHQLGYSGLRWVELWATNPSIQTSDLNEKTIQDYIAPELALSFVNAARPFRYNWNSDEVGKEVARFGFGAQHLAELVTSMGLEPESGCGLVRHDVIEEEGVDLWSASYTEIIPFNTAAIQALSANADARDIRIAELEARVQELEQN